MNVVLMSGCGFVRAAPPGFLVAVDAASGGNPPEGREEMARASGDRDGDPSIRSDSRHPPRQAPCYGILLPPAFSEVLVFMDSPLLCDTKRSGLLQTVCLPEPNRSCRADLL